MEVQKEKIDDLNQENIVLKERLQATQSSMNAMQRQISSLSSSLTELAASSKLSKPVTRVAPPPSPANTQILPKKSISEQSRRSSGEKSPHQQADALKQQELSRDAMVPNTPDSEPLKLYHDALAHYRQGNYSDAIAQFADFTRKYPQHEYADNAYYWIGESYYDQQEYRLAISAFSNVASRYPTGNKVPDALLKIAFSYERMGQHELAVRTLYKVVQAHPVTGAARIAEARLNELKKKGG